MVVSVYFGGTKAKDHKNHANRRDSKKMKPAKKGEDNKCIDSGNVMGNKKNVDEQFKKGRDALKSG